MVFLGKYMESQILKEYRYYGNELKGTTKGNKGPFTIIFNLFSIPNRHSSRVHKDSYVIIEEINDIGVPFTSLLSHLQNQQQ